MMGSTPTFDQLTRSQIRWLVRAIALDAVESSSESAAMWGSVAYTRAMHNSITQDDINQARTLFECGPFTPPAIEEVL